MLIVCPFSSHPTNYAECFPTTALQLTPEQKIETIHIPAGRKGLYIDDRSASMHTQKKANIPRGKNQVNRAAATRNFKAPFTLSPSFMFSWSTQETKLQFSERLRKWGIWRLLHLIYRFCPHFPHQDIEHLVKQVLHPDSSLRGNLRLITFSSSIWHRREPAVHWQVPCTSHGFQSEDISLTN